MQIYQEKIKQHYLNPHNSGIPKTFTHRAKVSNLSCGDEVEVFLTIEGNKIVNVHHVTEGCAIAIATASILSELLLNKEISDLETLSQDKLEEIIGMELAESRKRCAGLTLEALKDAVNSRVA